jgi:hypothetical protein
LSQRSDVIKDTIMNWLAGWWGLNLY